MQIIVGDHCLVVHNHNRQVNVFEYDPKTWSRHSCLVNAAIAYTEPETGQVVILLINQALEMKSLNHHLLCTIQCYVNGDMIDKVPKFEAPYPVKPLWCHPPNYSHIKVERSNLLLQSDIAHSRTVGGPEYTQDRTYGASSTMGPI